nr:DUF3021 family protein [Leucobacter edaphi]
MIVAGLWVFAILVALSFSISDPDLAVLARVAGVILGAGLTGTAIFDIARWPVLVRLLVHTVTMLAILLPCLVVAGWFNLSTEAGIVALLGATVSLGIAGWSIALIVMHYANKSKAKGKFLGNDR